MILREVSLHMHACFICSTPFVRFLALLLAAHVVVLFSHYTLDPARTFKLSYLRHESGPVCATTQVRLQAGYYYNTSTTSELDTSRRTRSAFDGISWTLSVEAILSHISGPYPSHWESL